LTVAFGVGGPGPEHHDEEILADINVTPLVDVMLVLLIIFMITAPMLHQGVEVALPRADAETLPLRVEDPLVLTVNRDGLVYVEDTPVHPSQIAERLLPILERRGDDTVFLKGDRDVAYGRVIEVLDLLHQAGVTRIGMITERPPPEGRGGSR
jgi:biopolymer transport protein TolR